MSLPFEAAEWERGDAPLFSVPGCHDVSVPAEESADLGTRFVAFEAWIAAQKQYITIGDLSWETGWSDIRRIATNYILRRQLEALDATAALAAAGLGHLTVGFIRPALDELLWMLWVKDLPQMEAQELLAAM